MGRHLRRFDRDADGTLSSEETEAALRDFPPDRQDAVRDILVTSDGDGDGWLDPAEMDTAQTLFAERFADANLQPRRRLLDIDPAVFDLNGDRSVRVDEITRYVALAQHGSIAPPDAFADTGTCDLPAAPLSAVVSAVGGRAGGPALSDHTLAGQDVPTRVVYLDLPDGTRPVYLLLQVEGPTIYQFSGATARIAQVVVGHRNGAAGVVGLDAEKISFRTMTDCFAEPLQGADGAASRAASEMMAQRLGRRVDHVILTPFLKADVVTGALTTRIHEPAILTSAGTWRIENTPASGRADPVSLASPGERLKARVVEAFLADYPLGLDTFGQLRIVSPAPPEPYFTLPGPAGLNAWMVSRFAAATGRENEVMLLTPILRWPGALAGTAPLTVLLPDRLPMPAGDPGPWTVLSEDRSLCLAGPRCP